MNKRGCMLILRYECATQTPWASACCGIKPRSGFMLIEVLVATAIATLLSAVLFTAYTFINQATVSIETRTDLQERTLLLTQQLTRDITGACFLRYPEKKPAASSATSGTGTTPQPFTKIFYGTHTDDHMSLLTFITNNPLPAYWSSQAGKAKPTLARVVYRLESEPVTAVHKKTSYALKRQESYTLDFDAFAHDAATPIRSYTVVKGIKNLKLTYGSLTEKESTDTAQPRVEYTSSTSWDKEKDQKKKKSPSLPNDVTVTVELWDNLQQRTKTTTTIIPIIPDFSMTSTATPATAQPAQQPPQAPATAQRPPTGQGVVSRLFGAQGGR